MPGVLLLALLAFQQLSPGTISGTVVDTTGAAISGAQIELAPQAVTSGNDGGYTLLNVPAGAFHLNINATGFAPQSVDGEVQPGEALNLQPAVMTVARLTTDVEVTQTRVELAAAQIKVQEKQRLLALVPNYYVTYLPNPQPLIAKQKFELAWKTLFDPASFVINGAIAGVQQARNDFSGYGQGAQGYAKRYGASYANFVSGTIISGAVLPSLLKQDPRYYYKGTGSKRSRILYAITRSFICQGDNGRAQFNYSSVLGDLAAGGISNLYYPAKDRNGAAVTFENFLLGLAGEAGGNLFQEFVARRLTPKKN